MSAWHMLPWWLAPVLALALGLMVLAPLGTQVLQRGVVFIDLAVAQAAAAAALWWHAWLDHPSAWSTRMAACGGAVLAVWWIKRLVERQTPHREALIGMVYVLSAALAVLGASQDPHGREHMTQLLSADVLWADWSQVGSLLALALLGGAWHMWMRVSAPAQTAWRDAVFYGWFALAASMSIGVLGLWLVFAGLIVPAWLHALDWSLKRRIMALGLACGGGLLISGGLDWPSGACVIAALAMLGLLAQPCTQSKM